MKDIQFTLKNGQAWSAVIAAGRSLKITSKNDSPNVALLMYHADQVLDRYNMPDTLKGQHISALKEGACLHSDMGKLLASIVDSDCNWHDPLCGLTRPKTIEQQYGKNPYCEAHNDHFHNGWDNMLVELGKHGMGKRDLVPIVNLFSKVCVGEDGVMEYIPDHAGTDSYIELRTEMKVLVILSNTPHPLHHETTYPGGDIELNISIAPPTNPQTDTCLNFRPENMRAWETTQSDSLMRSSI
jgi:urea carboxylase-associated protein 2